MNFRRNSAPNPYHKPESDRLECVNHRYRDGRGRIGSHVRKAGYNNVMAANRAKAWLWLRSVPWKGAHPPDRIGIVMESLSTWGGSKTSVILC
ncbi:uncharacterized protein N7483_006311 [Penicillium malachiteum]|uniref:uncharacterized protein n=1 Tax=Penicillium malachiteum TaxID=1324776 RepID=UPI0025477C98|nr:uncharacterized protein N7483_006311 [Penicillium malachiteum]KAJ5731803.1 hypothetical protein N7483_006311 [Penicillium malachiteum]